MLEQYSKINLLNCPRCGEIAYLECSDLEYIEELKSQLCLKCGYPDTGTDSFDPEKDAPRSNDIPKTSSGLCCLKFRNGRTSFYSISGDTTDEIISWFISVLQKPEIDPNGSYLNQWDGKAKTILRIGVDQAKRRVNREEEEEEVDEGPLV